jgi:HK97 family phage portal protein
VYERRADEGKDRALDHPVYPLLRRRPNAYQTAIRWRQLGMRHVLLRGNYYSLITTSTRRIRELLPLNPDRMRVVLLDADEAAGGSSDFGRGYPDSLAGTRSVRRGYLYRFPEGETVAFTQDEILHIMGASLDGITGCSVIEYARESVGRSTAEEQYNARFWSQGAALKGALVTDNRLTKEAREANKAAWQEAQHGWWNAHKVAMLEGGLKWTQIGVSARDAQYLEGRQFSVSDIARYFGVPPHMIGDVEKSTSWGTGIEQQTIGFLVTTMEPWFTLWEQEIDRQLLYDDDTYFCEFLRDAMLRADLAARTASHRQYVDGGIMSVNEVRAQLNLNPVDGEEYEKPLRAQNIGGGGNPATTSKDPPPAAGEATTQEAGTVEARARGVVLRAATRMVKRECVALLRWAERYAANPIGWREWVADFYGKHVVVLGETLGIEEGAARRYGTDHAAALLEQGLSVLVEWERHAPAQLTALALGDLARVEQEDA